MLLSKRTVTWLAILPFGLGLAADCTSSNAISWPTSDDPSSSNSNSGSSSDDSCSGVCGNDPTCLQVCLGIAAEGECNSIALIDGSDCVSSDDDDLDDLIKRRMKARTTLSCTSSESCFMYTDGSLLCINIDTGSFHDDAGGSGNLETGEYTAASGQQTTVSVEGTASEGTASRTSRTGEKTAISTSSHASNTKTGTVASNTNTETVASSTKAGTVASLTSTSRTSISTSGAERLSKHGSAIGVLGLVAYLL